MKYHNEAPATRDSYTPTPFPTSILPLLVCSHTPPLLTTPAPSLPCLVLAYPFSCPHLLHVWWRMCRLKGYSLLFKGQLCHESARVSRKGRHPSHKDGASHNCTETAI